jgi:mono/diheme cytochrome c family protein
VIVLKVLRHSKKRMCAGATLFFILVVAGCSDDGTTSVSENKQEQEYVQIDETRIAVLSRSCMSCHGIDLGGVPGDGPSLQTIGSRYSREEIKEILINGKNNGRMPKGLLEGGQAQEGDLEMMVEWLSQKK